MIPDTIKLWVMAGGNIMAHFHARRYLIHYAGCGKHRMPLRTIAVAKMLHPDPLGREPSFGWL